MRTLPLILAASLSILPLCAHTQPPDTTGAGNTPTDAIAAAIADPEREDDRADDARRHLEEIIRFTGVQPGDIIAEIAPGGGYWTRVFSRIAGAGGHVYTIWPAELDRYAAKSKAQWQQLVRTPHYANVDVLSQPAADFDLPTQVDLVFTSQNWHDYHNFELDIAALTQQIFASVKPGGSVIIIDHSAPAGTGAETTATLHRIDPDLVRAEFTAAGFTFTGASNALVNAADPRDVGVFDDSIRGRSDQFIYRFRKPAGDGSAH